MGHKGKLCVCRLNRGALTNVVPRSHAGFGATLYLRFAVT